MKLSNQMYDFLKLLGTIILPAVAVFYQTLAGIWGLPFSEQVPSTIMAIVVLLNSCLGISSAAYYKDLANNIRQAEGTLEVEDIEHQVGGEEVEDRG